MYSKELQEYVENIDDKKYMISLSLNKSKRVKIEEATSFMNSWYKFLPLKVRCSIIKQNITEKNYPRCPRCQSPVSFRKDYCGELNKFCSTDCQNKFNTENKLIFTHEKLKDQDWLLDQRINQRKSCEQIAKELQLSTGPVYEAIDFFKIPRIHLQESMPDVMLKLRDKEWLIHEHITKHQTLENLASQINSSVPTLSRWMEYHNIECNDPNSYPRKISRDSKGCNEVIEFIESLGIQVEKNNRSILDGKEIDIYIPTKQLAIEYNGLFWHSEYSKNKNYHLNKTIICKQQGITLYHLWEDDWIFKKDIWKSKIKNVLGLTENILSARKCQIKTISSQEKSSFMRINHLQGNDRSSINLGLFHNEQLVSCMTFCKSRFSKHTQWELSRFCSILSTQIRGAFSKCLKYFTTHYQGSIITYADQSYSNGDVYDKNGFKKLNESYSNYWYIDQSFTKRLHRSAFMKKKIAPNDPRPEWEIMAEKGYKRIFGPGTITFIKE